MRTKEIMDKYGVSKEALRYYEKQKLITPSRDENGYRHYHQQDLLMLDTIVKLRQLDISTDQIQLILSHQMSLLECLENQEKYVQSKILYYEDILQQVQAMISRTKIEFVLVPIENHYLLFTENEIIIQQDQRTVISYQDIKRCVLSMCSRKHVKKSQILSMLKVNYDYHVDIDIITDEKTYRFESLHLENMKHIMNRLNRHVEVIDDLNLKSIFAKSNYESLIKDYFPKWASLYHLDNPRYETLETMYSAVDNALKKGRKSVMKRRQTLEQIDGTINYVPSSHLKVNFVFQVGEADDLIFDEKGLYYQNQEITYDKIQNVSLSMCSRIYNPGALSSGPVDFFVKTWQRGAPLTAGMVHMVYSMDLDIETDEEIYSFESNSFQDMDILIGLFHKHHIQINDPIGIEKILNQYPDKNDRQQFFDHHFKQLAKKYQLDNPRGTYLYK